MHVAYVCMYVCVWLQFVLLFYIKPYIFAAFSSFGRWVVIVCNIVVVVVMCIGDIIKIPVSRLYNK